MMKGSQLKGLTYFILAYMVVAFVWWSVLLFAKNRDAYHAKVELLQLGMAAEGLIKTPMDFYVSERYQGLIKAYRKQERMIIGETIFLTLTLLGGLFIIYMGYRKEVESSKQQRNFLLSITHELKSPIAGIRLGLQTLEKRSTSLTIEQIEKLSKNGIKEADRLNKLVENLLLSARLESAYQFHQESLDLGALLEKHVVVFREKFPEASIVLNIADNLPPVLGDRQALTSVVINLIENAVKYSGKEPVVCIRLQQEASELVIEVADQGIGISDDEKEKVFTKFYRVGSEDTRRTKGTGLGLFIVNKIIHEHDGRVNIIDNEPKGSVFQVVLPVYNLLED